MIDIYLTHQYKSPGLLLFLDDLKDIAHHVKDFDIGSPQFTEKFEFFIKILALLPIFSLNNLSQLLMLKTQAPTIILRAYASFPKKVQAQLVRPMLAALKTTIRTQDSTRCLESDQGRWLVYLISVIK